MLRLPEKSKITQTVAPAEPDLISDSIFALVNLKKDEVIAQLALLEDTQEQTYFQIGGLLSAMQSKKWYESCASLDEWVEQNTAMKRSKARVLVQIYDALVESKIKWAQVKHIGWTKLRSIARVLTPDNAEEWIKFATDHSKNDIIERVKKELATLDLSDDGGVTATQSKTIKIHAGQNEAISADIDLAIEKSTAADSAVTLGSVSADYLAGQALDHKLPHLSVQAAVAALKKMFTEYEDHEVREILELALADYPENLEMTIA